ncbi:MAG TPA: hypothetical protein VGI88_00750 [Verrucomicrobiae bacterium]|jgi:hypothetical protein
MSPNDCQPVDGVSAARVFSEFNKADANAIDNAPAAQQFDNLQNNRL